MIVRTLDMGMRESVSLGRLDLGGRSGSSQRGEVLGILGRGGELRVVERKGVA